MKLSMKQLAKTAYSHREATGMDLETDFKLTSKQVKKLLQAFQELLDEVGVIDNIVTANLYYDPASDHQSSISTTDRVLMGFKMDY